MECDSLKSQQLKADEKIINLENENQLLLKQLKSNSSKLNNSALLELENFNRKQLETERRQLIEEVDSLKFDLKRVTNELEFTKIINQSILTINTWTLNIKNYSWKRINYSLQLMIMKLSLEN